MSEWLTVFGTAQGGGNPALIVRSGPGESQAKHLQELARREGLPVCVHLEESGLERRVRFYSPARELPFCAFGALAAGAVILRETANSSASLRIGSREVRVDRQADTFVLTSLGAWVRDDIPEREVLFAALRLAPDEVRSLRIASIGSPKVLVELESPSHLTKILPDAPALALWSQVNRINGAYIFSTTSPYRLRARAFHPLADLREDTATGVAAGALVWSLGIEPHVWLSVTQLAPGRAPCEILARRLPNERTEVGGRVLLATAQDLRELAMAA